jgi:pyocin large subunit-like protein
MRDVKHMAFGLLAAAALGLTACERGGGAEGEPARSQAEVASPDAADLGGQRTLEEGGSPSSDQRASREEGGDREDPRDGPQPQHDDGAPLWAANRSLTAEEAARKQFERNGETFGADTVAEYVDQAHAFIAKPPAGVERATRSRNGDKLFYDPKSNTFLVATKDGAPRTMFKPDDGAEYWAKQKAQASGRSSARRSGDDQG